MSKVIPRLNTIAKHYPDISGNIALFYSNCKILYCFDGSVLKKGDPESFEKLKKSLLVNLAEYINFFNGYCRKEGLGPIYSGDLNNLKAVADFVLNLLAEGAFKQLKIS